MARRRIWAYVTTAAGIVVLHRLLADTTWVGDPQLHTLAEAVATVIAGVVGVIALVRFSSLRNNTFLFIGVGFLGTAALDGYHAVVTSVYFARFLPSDLASLIPWSWVASRLALSVMLALAWLAWRREERLGLSGRVSATWVISTAAFLTLGTFLFFAFVPLPAAYFPNVFTPRPEEFVPALAFAIALVGFLRKGEWRRDSFEHWLVLALVVNVVAQSVVMPSSAQLYDTSFALAHLLKGVSYVLVMIGLLCSMLALFRTAQEGNERIRSVIGNAADGIITIDERGIMLEFNPAAEQIFHRSADQVIGRNIKILMPEPDHSRHDGYLEAYRSTGEPKILREGRTVQGKRADGTEFPMDLSVSQIEIGDQTAFVGIVRDVTERVEREREIQARSAKLEAANADLEAFAYSVSHDLRTPVLSISGLSEHLINDHSDSLDTTGRGFLKRIHAASMNMSGLIDALLKLAHISTGELVVGEIDVSNLAEEVAESLRDGLGPNSSVQVDITPHLEAQADRRLLRIVLENLMHNSLKYSQQEGAPGRIEMGSETIDGETTFFVRDNGVGFDMDHAKHLFIPFHRVHSSDAFEGTGIGLATVSRIIGRHGGRVWAKAAPGEGATFYFTLGPTPS